MAQIPVPTETWWQSQILEHWMTRLRTRMIELLCMRMVRPALYEKKSRTSKTRLFKSDFFARLWKTSILGPSYTKKKKKKVDFLADFCEKIHLIRNQNSTFSQKLEFSGCKSRSPDKIEMWGYRVFLRKKLEFWKSNFFTFLQFFGAT